MKKIIILFILIVLLSASTLVQSKSLLSSFYSDQDEINQISISPKISQLLYKFFILTSRGNILSKNDIYDDYSFIPDDINLRDDAFHGADSLHFTEWWYFDSIFDNGYSIQIGIRIVGLANQGLVHLRLDIYKDGKLISHEIKPYLIWEIFASKEIPLVELNGKKIMEGYIDNETGNMVYDLDIKLDTSSTNLKFIGCTTGWQGRTPGGKWAVILPRAEVEGSINFNNEKINVSGIGYHDHNWEVTLFTGINFGWHWGKMNSESYTITWAKIMTTRFWGQSLLVINEKNEGYINIEPEYIDIQINEYTINQGMLIPYSFTIDAEKGNVSMHVDMEVIDIHHVRWMGIINYWRYHMQCKGFISIGNIFEPINQMEITEFIRFR